MKKIIDPCIAGGTPWSDDTLQGVLNKEVWLAMESILQGVSDPSATGNVGVIVSGCKITGSGPYDCSSGYVYMNGQFMYFPGFTGQTLPQYIVPASLSNITKVYKDGVSRNLITQQDATYQNSAPGSGQYITLSTKAYLGNPGGVSLLPGFVGPWNNFTLLNSWTSPTIPFRWRFIGSGLIQIAANPLVVPAGLSNTVANIPASWNVQNTWGNARWLVTCLNAGRENSYLFQLNASFGTITISNISGGALTLGDLLVINLTISPDIHSI